MKNIRNIFFVLFLLLSWDSLAIEKYIHINKEEYNLSCDLVRSIYQDSRGYIWIGTEMGLNRFDGVRMRHFKSADYKLPSDYIFSITEDKKGNIWFSTSRGVACYDYSSDSFFIPLLQDGNRVEDIVSSIAVNSKGEVWFSLNKEEVLYKFDYSKEYLDSYSVKIGKGPKYIAFDKNDRMIFVSGVSIYGYDTCECVLDTLYARESEPNALYERTRGPFISEYEDDVIYFATEDELCKLDLDIGSLTTLYEWGKDQLPLSISKSYDKERFLISTTTGIYQYDIPNGKLDVFHADEYCVTCHVREDSSYLVASHDYGLKVYMPDLCRFTSVESTDCGISLENIGITSITYDGADRVWISTKSKGLLEYNIVTGVIDRLYGGKLPVSLNVVCYDDGVLWVGSEVGLYEIDIRSSSVRRKGASSISRIIKTSAHDILVGDKHSLNILDKDTGAMSPVDGLDLSELVSQRAVGEDNAGVLWIPTYGSGLFSYNPQTKIIRQYIISEENDYAGIPDMVTSVLPMKNGDVLAIGSKAQVSRIIHGTEVIVNYDCELIPSLPDASYLNGLEDYMGRLWLATNTGLACMDMEQEYAILYTEKTGLSTNIFTGPCCNLNSGEMLFATVKGLVRFSPEDFADEDLKVDIVSFKSGDSDFSPVVNINDTDRIEIPFDKNSFGFSFAVPGYLLPYSVKCFLEGYDEKWRTLGQDHDVYFYNVPPGEYILKIDGHKDVTIIVIPPFWSSSKGISLIVLLSLLACFIVLNVVYRRRERIANERAKEKLINEKLNFLSGFVALEQFVADGKETEFMKKFDEVITSHLSDEGFTVEMLAKELAMSHTSLGRYTLSTFGTSPVNYIRTKRLAVASHLLKQGGLSVSDISYKCGFSSPAYFAKCFKDAYGMTPSQYQSSH